jgi:hypothetical protein
VKREHRSKEELGVKREYESKAELLLLLNIFYYGLSHQWCIIRL